MWQEQGKDFSFSLLGCCQADMVEVEGGWWQAQMMTNRLLACLCSHWYSAHWGCPGSLCSPSCYCWSWSCRESVRHFCLGMQGHTVTHLQCKCDDFSFWLMYRPMSWQPWAAGGQIALYAFKMEVMILQLSACVRQICMQPREVVMLWLYFLFLCLFGLVGHTSYFVYANKLRGCFLERQIGYLHAHLHFSSVGNWSRGVDMMLSWS